MPQNSTWDMQQSPAVLQFRDCPSVALVHEFLELLSTSSLWTIGKDLKDGYVQCIRDALAYAGHLDAETVARATNADLVTWLRGWSWDDLYSTVGWPGPAENCWLELCRVERWDGNPDVAGVGMLVTYVFQASLVTACIFALAVSRLEWSSARADRVSTSTRTLLAVRHSTGSFLSASFVFCIAMLFASLVATVDDASNARLTTWALMLIVPISSVLPVLILYLATGNTLRRAKGWKMLWSVVAILLFALMVRSWHAVRTDGATPGRWDIVQSQWESNCLIRPGVLLGPIINLALVVGGLLFLGIGAHLVHFVVSKRRRAKEEKATRLLQIMRLMTLVSAFSVMWTFVGWLVYFTLLLRDRTRNGNKDQEWGFGQILALATWIPCVVEFAYVWWENPKEALNGRLMEPYSVVEAPEKPQSLEIGDGCIDVEDDQRQRLI